MAPFDLEGSRMAMLAELAGHRGPGFSVSFGGPPTFRPPFGADFAPRQAMLSDFTMTRPPFGEAGFGADGQMFNPLARGGKDKANWQTFSNGTASSSK